MCTRFRRAFVRRLQNQLQTGYILKYPNCKVSIFLSRSARFFVCIRLHKYKLNMLFFFSWVVCFLFPCRSYN